MTDLRTLGATNIRVSAVAFGTWPIAAMTSLNVREEDSLATLAACPDLGINFLDTAYCYGADGESEKLIAKVFAKRRDEIVIATKGGLHWDAAGKRVFDGTPARLKQECEESLQRLQTDYLDLLYLHAPDPHTPVTESAGALLELMQAGKTRSVGVSNFTLEQLIAFHAVCPITAFQPPYNLIVRGIERDTLPWCLANQVSVCPYWPLMKGLLSGKLPRDFVFQPGDGRAKYPMFQGDEWRKNQDLLDRLRAIAADCGRSVTEIVINWTIHQPGITSALCGAKRPDQLRESAAGMGWKMSPAQFAAIDAALAERGKPIERPAV